MTIATKAQLTPAAESPVSAARRHGFDLLDHLKHGFHRCSGNDAMAKIEDMAWAVRGRGQNLLHAPVEHIRRSEKGNRIKIALHRRSMFERSPRIFERSAPIETENICARLSHRGKKSRRIDTEVDDGHTERLDPLD